MPRILHDYTGQEFGELVVIERDLLTINTHKTSQWIVLCNRCGNIKSMRIERIKNSRTGTCGCVNIKHHLTNTHLYHLWIAIKQRCYNKDNNRFKYYGGRGISLYEKWINDPVSFIEYVSNLENCGKEKYSLDRINNDGHYEPDNLKWSTQFEQIINSRKVKLNWDKVRKIRELSKTLHYKEIAKMFGMNEGYIYTVIRNKFWKE